ncbi:MAG: hypothetical protein IAE97_00210 [Chthoniobacterales bacterium]|nr:hypothetical protein [Chthoniobacterales bacterium]
MKTPTLIKALCALIACAGLTACPTLSGLSGSLSYDPATGLNLGGSLPPAKTGLAK